MRKTKISGKIKISNSTLALLMAASIVLSLAGTVLLLKTEPIITGAQTKDILISNKAAIFLSTGVLDLGSGYVEKGSPYAVIDTDSQIVQGGTWQLNKDAGFIITNEGSEDIKIAVRSSKNAWELIGGDPGLSSYKFKASASTDENGCYTYDTENRARINMLSSDWVEFNRDMQVLCGNLKNIDGMNGLRVDFRLQIPKNAGAGERQDELEFMAIPVS